MLLDFSWSESKLFTGEVAIVKIIRSPSQMNWKLLIFPTEARKIFFSRMIVGSNLFEVDDEWYY